MPHYQFSANKKLHCLLGTIPPPSSPLPPSLQEVLDEGISAHGELTLLSRMKGRLQTESRQDIDPTEIECSVNEIQLDDHLPADNKASLFSAGWEFGLRLKDLLPRDRDYVLILSLSQAEYDESLWTCTFRFHTLRKGQNWIADNLDGYTREGIARCVSSRTI